MKTILAPVDFSPATRGVIAAAQTLAQSLEGRIVLLHILQPPVITTDYGLSAEVLRESIALGEDAARSQLAHLETALAAKGVNVTSVLVGGTPASAIHEQARKTRAHYIVLGSHGHTAFYDLLVGSTTHAVLKNAPCPVLVVPRMAKKAARKAR